MNNLSVQPIDIGKNLNELRTLERFWIRTLKTLKPSGLNYSEGVLV